jgi:hypothetical protein
MSLWPRYGESTLLWRTHHGVYATIRRVEVQNLRHPTAGVAAWLARVSQCTRAALGRPSAPATRPGSRAESEPPEDEIAPDAQ